MVKAATVEGYAKEQQGNIQEKDEQEEEKLVELLEKIEHNTDPENLKKKEKVEGKKSDILDTAENVLIGGGVMATLAKLLNPVTKVIAAGAAGYAAGTMLYDNSEAVRNVGDSAMEAVFGHIETTEEMETKRKAELSPAKRKDIYEGRKRLIDLSEAETVKKANASKLSAAEDKVTASKESKDAAKLVSNVTNAPTTNNIVSGGGSGRFRQNVYNPDSSFNKWVDSRVSYV